MGVSLNLPDLMPERMVERPRGISPAIGGLAFLSPHRITPRINPVVGSGGADSDHLATVGVAVFITTSIMI